MQRRAGAEYGNAGRGNAAGHRYRRTHAYPQPDAGANRYASPNLDARAYLDANPGANPDADAHAGAHLDTSANLDSATEGYPAAATDAPAYRHAHAPPDRYTPANCYAGSQSADQRGPASVKRSKCLL